MAVQSTDVFALERGGVPYKETIANLLTNVALPSDAAFAAAWNGDTGAASKNAIYDQFIALDNKIDALGTNEHEAADIAARDALTGIVVGDKVFVTDASADATVVSGWAIYRANSVGPVTWFKIAEGESLDITVSTPDLGYTASATQGVVTNTAGGDATLPAATSTNAGLMVPAQFTKLGNITVTGAVNLDTISTNDHVAVTTAGTATTNPITLTGQELGFSISALATAP